MSVQHLHLIQCSYQRLPECLQELRQIYQENDIICLLEDATLAMYDIKIQEFPKVLLLTSDATFIHASNLTSTNVEMIEYLDLANYIDQADKVLTWR